MCVRDCVGVNLCVRVVCGCAQMCVCEPSCLRAVSSCARLSVYGCGGCSVLVRL